MSYMPGTMLPSLRVQRYGNDSEGSTPSKFVYGRASGSSLLKQRQDILRVESLGHPPDHPQKYASKDTRPSVRNTWDSRVGGACGSDLEEFREPA